MANKFCRYLSNAYRFNQQQGKLHYQPCCWIPYNEPVTDRESLQKSREFITAEISKDFNKNCHWCLSRERGNFGISGRKTATEHIPEDAVDGDAYSLEFQIDTHCNAACAMCGPHFSTLWQKQLGQIPISKVSSDLELMSSTIDFDKITLVRFFGGEPLLTDTHMQVLAMLPHPEQVTLSYCTNGSIYPNEEILARWQEFKRVRLVFSLDGIGERFEYIRWPLKWERVESNFIRIAETFPNIGLRINYTVNPLNVWYVNEFVEWVTPLQERFPIEFVFSPCVGTLGISALSPNMFRELVVDEKCNRHVHGLLRSYPADEERHKKALEFLDSLDSMRNINWRTTFPEFANRL